MPGDDLEMPTPCTSCGRMVELNDMHGEDELYCKSCWPEVDTDRQWEEAADSLDELAAVDLEWGVQPRANGGIRSRVRICGFESAAREHLAARLAAGDRVELVARRVITGPWEAR